jgi:hypothetical protein
VGGGEYRIKNGNIFSTDEETIMTAVELTYKTIIKEMVIFLNTQLIGRNLPKGNIIY